MIELTPAQARGLKLAKDGDLVSDDGKKWCHLNATVTYARTDRFKERPQKVKYVTNATMTELRAHGLLKEAEAEGQNDNHAHSITMAGKMWLLRNK